jgi:Tfp pilus assembly protein PilV
MLAPDRMMIFTTIKSPRGINLLELVLAIALCGMALLAVVGVQWRHHKAMQKDEIRIEARAAAASLLQEVEASLKSSFDGIHKVALSPVPAELDPDDRFTYLIDESYEDAESNLKKVEVQIHWDSPQGPRTEVLWCVFLRGE